MRRKKDHEKRKKHLRPVAEQTHSKRGGNRGRSSNFNSYFYMGDDMTEEEMETAERRDRFMIARIDIILKQQQRILIDLEESLSNTWMDQSRLAEVQDAYERIAEIGSNLRYLEYQISLEPYSAKQVREGGHIYGQLPDGLTLRQKVTVGIVVSLIAIFAWVMI